MKITNRFTKLTTGAGAAALLAGGTLVAGDYGKAIIDDKAPIVEPWSYCDLFDLSTLYEGDGFIKEIALTGRYHGQAISQQEDFNDTLNNGYHEWQHRRSRLGLDIEFGEGFTFSSSFNITDGSGGRTHPYTTGRYIDDIDELYIEWENPYAPSGKGVVSEPLLEYVQVGKQKQRITREFSTSSKRILTIERSHIVNEIADNKPWGITFGVNALGLTHEFGAWVYGADLDSTGEGYLWPDFDSRGGASYRTSFEMNDNTELFFDYVYTNNSDGFANPGGSADDDLGSVYEHAFAIGSESEWGRLGLITDLIFAFDREAQTGDRSLAALAPGAIPAGNDTWGAVIMPYYDITDKLQFVAKYAYMDEGRNQRTQRYGYNAANGFDGQVRQVLDGYHTFYAGLNYYICEHNLKLMGGYEYATGDEFGTGNDIDSGTWMVAVRTYF